MTCEFKSHRAHNRRRRLSWPAALSRTPNSYPPYDGHHEKAAFHPYRRHLYRRRGCHCGGGLAGKRSSGVETESSNTKVIKAVEREEQVVLVSLGMEGLSEESATSKLWNWQVPGSERTQYIKYSYRAKLGIEGSQVQVEEESPHHFRVQIPEFIFIGHSDENFETAVEDNGALSWITPDIDKAETITKILNEDKKKEDIADNRDVLQSHAKQFYTGIISGVDPEAEVDFSFR